MQGRETPLSVDADRELRGQIHKVRGWSVTDGGSKVFGCLFRCQIRQSARRTASDTFDSNQSGHASGDLPSRGGSFGSKSTDAGRRPRGIQDALAMLNPSNATFAVDVLAPLAPIREIRHDCTAPGSTTDGHGLSMNICLTWFTGGTGRAPV